MAISLYWDDFQRRATECAEAIKSQRQPPIRRVSVFVTNKCNFKCKYCRHSINETTLTEKNFHRILGLYGDTALIHITGGEPSIVPWLYPLLKEKGNQYRFHLNTNAFIKPPASSVKRLKISLDHWNSKIWDKMVGHPGAFQRVTQNIAEACSKTVVSLTCVLNKQTFRDTIKFANFASQFKDLYAVFFSVYKGNNPEFAMSSQDVEIFFEKIIPRLENELSLESLNLLRETIDEKRRLLQGVRFPENSPNRPCYLSMSERVFSPNGEEFTCSHLYRDKIYTTKYDKHPECLYGCNRRLVKFNQEVEEKLFRKE